MRITDHIHAITFMNEPCAPNGADIDSPFDKPSSVSIFDAFPDNREATSMDERSKRLFQIAWEYVSNIPEKNFTDMATKLGEMAADNGSDSSFSVPLDIDLIKMSNVSCEQTPSNPTCPRDETITEIPESIMMRSDLEQFLQNIFQPFRSQDHAQEIDDLVEDRAKKLIAENIDAKKLAQLLRTAEKKDTVTSILHGAVQGAAPFAGASLAVDLALGEIFTTTVTSNLFALGAAAGAFQGAVDVVAGTAMQQAFNDAYYTKVAENNKNATPMMLEWQKEREATIGAQTKNLVRALALPYFFRNALRDAVDISLTATVGPASVPIANLVIDSIGGLAAGAGMRYMLNQDDWQAARMHTAYVLARTDWLSNLLQLDEGVSLNSIRRTGSVIIKAVTDVVRSIPSGISALASWPAVTEVVMLAGGLAALLPTQASAADTVSGHGPVASEIAVRVINTVGLAILYAAMAAGISFTQRR